MIKRLRYDPTWPYHEDVNGYRNYMATQLMSAVHLMKKHNILKIDENAELNFRISFEVIQDVFGEGVRLVFSKLRKQSPIYQELNQRGLRILDPV